MSETIAAYLQITPWPLQADALLWTALTLVAGGLLGELVFRLTGLPRIVGYGVAGLLAALSGHGLHAGRLSGSVRLVVDLALALLLFELGSRIHLRWLRANPALLLTSLTEVLLSFTASYGLLRWLGLDHLVALACATITLPTSAAVVGRVSTELGAAGQVSERVLVLTGLSTLYAVLAHKLLLAWLRIDLANNWMQDIAQPLYTFCGSVLLAIVLAHLVGLIARRLDLKNENSVLLLLGLVVLALTAATKLNLSTLLVPLMAGVLLRNHSERPWVWPRHFGTAGGVLVLMLFVIVGSALSVEALASGGLIALLLLGVRLLGKGMAIAALARWSGISQRQAGALTLALMPISATALVLHADLQLAQPALAERVAPIVLSVIAVMGLLGPIAVLLGLTLANECPPQRSRRNP